ncbi:class I SAM-dependent methyltransferase [Phyllobacterium myrsinacearum]|uniref:Phospholipid N-methyltransferase n=1 Tax=Phyllobacterium myrsinacearum TaxID=28101 RepID=A0A839EWX6_9HYPH|nr:methyltransferase domain-containing protein [Phyllobacterium myrsinacearum]MBA8881806.1 phospholipid N-methyltransferase [Phyllobacterium myrsinacearum]
MSLSDLLAFLRSWIRSPLRTAAIMPSGVAVSALMTQEIDPGFGPVLELGPGTGPFTRSLLARGIPETELTLVEYSLEFTTLLKRRFPKARILQMDAAQIGEANLYETGTVGAVVSGLGVLTMQPRQVKGILSGAFKYLRPGGSFYQITYGPRCPVSPDILDHLHLETRFVGRTMRNVPPASVYRINRLSSLSATE